MVVGKILKQLTPAKIKNELATIGRIKIPPNLENWVRKYEKTGKRSRFIWKLFLKVRREINFLPVRKSYQSSLREIGFLITVFVVIFDDVADQEQNSKLLNELRKIPFAKDCVKSKKLNRKEKYCLNLAAEIWQRINQLMEKAPYYAEFKDVFRHDINQMLYSINRDIIINNNRWLINKTEYWLHSPHSMQFIAGNAVNLMHLPRFGMKDVRTIREISWQSQKMARVGNCVSTWEREINDNDFSGGVFAYAIDSKILRVYDLTNTKRNEIVNKIKKANIEGELLEEWEKARDKILQLWKENKIKTINVKRFLKGLDNLLELEMASKNHK